MKITRFEDIEAWQIAWDLSQFIYSVVKKGNSSAGILSGRRIQPPCPLY